MSCDEKTLVHTSIYGCLAQLRGCISGAAVGLLTYAVPMFGGWAYAGTLVRQRMAKLAKRPSYWAIALA